MVFIGPHDSITAEARGPKGSIDDFGGEDEDEGVVGVVDVGFADHDLLALANIDAGEYRCRLIVQVAAGLHRYA